MNIAVTTEQRRWLDERVAAGCYASLDEAVQVALVGLMSSSDEQIDQDDDGVRALLDEARVSLARGEGLSLDEFKAHAARRRARLG